MSIFNYRETPGYLARLKDAVRATRRDLSARMDRVMGLESDVDGGLLDGLEEVLISADMGAATAASIVKRVRERATPEQLRNIREIKRLLKAELREILHSAAPVEAAQPHAMPRVVMLVGVNGVGKTTTIGKLAHACRLEGKKVLVCAADTFRAAAVEQLAVWAERNQVTLVKQGTGADPSAVLHDAISAARARGIDVLIVDTAGRLHTKHNLMRELEKMRRVAGREIPGAPHDVYLVLDATTGQNGLAQAREFTRAAGVTGLIVTKLDGTARGGIVVAISRELQVPICYVGVGEGLEDLMPFSAEAYVEGLFD